jgi:hypothetical protein
MMSSGARQPEAPKIGISVLDDGTPFELFEVVELVGELARVRTAFLFEVGEVLAVRIERGDEVWESRARVRAHTGAPDTRITELELSQQTAPRKIVSG